MSFDPRLASGMGVLAAIVDAGSFVRAAEALDMTQSGVSRALARLEARLGVRVLDRSTRSVALTDEGRRFYERISPLMADIEAAAEFAAGGVQAVRGRLRLNVDPYFSRLVLAPQLGRFLDAHPALEIDIVARDRLGDLVADGMDLAVRFGEPRPSTLVARKLLETRVLTVASPAYLARHGRPARPQDLSGPLHECLQYRDPETGRPFPWEFHRGKKILTVPTQGRVTLNHVGTMHGLCVAGHGVAQVMALGAQPWLDSGALIDLFPEWPGERFPLYALYPSRQWLPSKVRAFIDFIAAMAR